MTKVEKILSVIAAAAIVSLILLAYVVGKSQSQVDAGAFYSPNYSPAYSIGTSTPVATFQVASASTTASTTLELGASSRTVGTCLKMYRTDGTAVYVNVNAGATTLNITTNSCASTVKGF